jgi:hypothetical protein
MNRPQIIGCVQRMPKADAVQFVALLREAEQLITRAAELRRQAWALYRETGRKDGAPRTEPQQDYTS